MDQVVKWWQRLSKRPTPPRPFVSGMTLQPGETADLWLAPPDELIEAIREGGKQTIRQGPTIHDGAGKFHSEVELIIERRDGTKVGAKIRMEWESE